MKIFFKCVLTLIVGLLSFSVFGGVNRTFLGPNIKFSRTDTFISCFANSVAGEVGARNFRLGGTLGWQTDENQRLKISGEYLYQRINYHFSNFNSEQWVHQMAVGGHYQYQFRYSCFDPTVGLRAWYSHAPSKNRGLLKAITRRHIIRPLHIQRRLAGSDAGGVAPSFTFRPWHGGLFEADLNYDLVSYEKDIRHSNNNKGLGATVRLAQAVVGNVFFDATASVRKPFNHYGGSINWTNVHYYGQWILGFYGGYTIGKNSLPNTFDAGFITNYYVDRTGESTSEREIAVNFINLKCGVIPEFLTWASDPAVYVPEALVVSEEGLA